MLERSFSLMNIPWSNRIKIPYRWLLERKFSQSCLLFSRNPIEIFTAVTQAVSEGFCACITSLAHRFWWKLHCETLGSFLSSRFFSLVLQLDQKSHSKPTSIHYFIVLNASISSMRCTLLQYRPNLALWDGECFVCGVITTIFFSDLHLNMIKELQIHRVFNCKYPT